MLLVVVQGDGRHEDAWLSCNVFLRAAAAAVAAASASSAAVASVFHQPTPAGIIHRALSTNVEAKAHASGRPRRRLRQTGSRAAGTHARACVTRADADTHKAKSTISRAPLLPRLSLKCSDRTACLLNPQNDQTAMYRQSVPSVFRFTSCLRNFSFNVAAYIENPYFSILFKCALIFKMFFIAVAICNLW